MALSRGIPDTLSALAAGLRDTGASRVYVALDRDATDRAIALARTFGTRGRSSSRRRTSGRRATSTTGYEVGAKGDPAAFRSVLERAIAMSFTPWVLQIQRLPPDSAPWALEQHPGVRGLLCEIAHQGPLSRDAHLRLLAEWHGVKLATLQEAARELVQSAETEP